MPGNRHAARFRGMHKLPVIPFGFFRDPTVLFHPFQDVPNLHANNVRSYVDSKWEVSRLPHEARLTIQATAILDLQDPPGAVDVWLRAFTPA